MTEPYVKDFQAFARNGAAGAPPWLREIREGAIARFAALGFPTMKQEAWRFTSVAPIAEQHFTLAPSPVSRLPSPAVVESLVLGLGPRIVFVDGRYAPGLSSLAGLPEGVQATSLAAATRAGSGGELARRHLARYAPWQDSAFAALNTAFLADGAFVHVARDTALAQPLEVLFLATSGAGRANGPTPSRRWWWVRGRASSCTGCSARAGTPTTSPRHNPDRNATVTSHCMPSRWVARSPGTTSPPCSTAQGPS